MTKKTVNLVLLHGWSLGSWIWGNLIPHLKDNWRLWIIDLPGYGTAKSCNTTDIDRITQQIAAQIPSKAVIVGWSLGGLIGIKLADLRPDIKALILLASSPCFINKPNWQHVIDANDLQGLAIRLKQDKIKGLRQFAHLVVSGDHQPRLSAKKLINNMLLYAPTMPTLDQGLHILQQDIRFLLAQQTLPIALVLGENDVLVRSSIKIAIKTVNSAINTFQIAQVGHAPMLSKPQQTAAVLAKFIGSL